MGRGGLLGGSGVLGAVQVEMLRTLAELGVRPDLVLGTSIGALNEAVLAAQALFAAGTVRRLHELARSGVAEHRRVRCAGQ